MTKKYFSSIKTLTDLKKAYRKLAKKYHPDLNHDHDTTSTMKAINIEYDTLFKQLQSNSTDWKEKKEQTHTYKDIINELIKHDNITIDIVGSWLWIYGDGTKDIKDTLKSFNFRWSKAKKKWYYYDGIEKSKRKRGKKSYNDIIVKYGVNRLQGKNNSDNNKKEKPLQPQLT